MEWDRATVVHPRSLEIFDSLGILEPLLAAGVKQRGARLHSDGEVLGEFTLDQCGSRYPFNIGISEEVTERVLTDYLAVHGGTVVRGTKLVAWQEREDGIVATLDHGGVTKDIRAGWVVGCDGHHSTVRRLAGIAQDGHDITEPWAVFDAAIRDWPHAFEANYGYLDEVPLILTALPHRRWRVYLRPRSHESDLVEDALSTLRRYLPSARFEGVSNPARFHCHTKVARRFRDGRVLLAGDAAHTCSPAQGHGMNSGLQDAYNLAWKLALVCKGHCSPDLLESYHDERHPVAEQVTMSGDAAETVQLMRDEAERHERDAAIRGLLADPAARHHEAVAEAELDIDYAASPIVMGDRGDTLWPGQRLPDWIEVMFPTGETGLLHGHTSRCGHTAFLVAGPSAHGHAFSRTLRDLGTLSDGALVEAVIGIASNSVMPGASAVIAPGTAEELRLGDLALLVVRPDGHIGLRADRDHAEALAAYVERLRSARTDSRLQIR